MLRLSRRRLLPTLAGLIGLPRALPSSPAMAKENAFPADFVWGASTSSYQIEGAVDADGRGKSIWDIFCHTPGKVKGGDTGDVACDHYRRWPEDVEWLQRGGFSAYRFSTAWPRILPTGAGAVETRGLDFYDRLVDGLLARGVAPWLCLYHWDLPQALQAEHSQLRLGTVINVQPARPSSARDEDRRAAERFDAFWNGAVLDPLFKGVYPAAIAADFAPLVAPGDLATIKQPIDFFGLNYYAPMYVAAAPQTLFGAWFGAAPAGTRFTAFGWPIDPSGLTDALRRLRDQYGNPEIYVTENGACYDDPVAPDGTVHDDDRVAYLRDHLTAARRALADGVNLRGYFVWSLLDNFEWAEGYSRRFGIIHVDFKSLRRTPKMSFAFLADIARRRG